MKAYDTIGVGIVEKKRGVVATVGITLVVVVLSLAVIVGSVRAYDHLMKNDKEDEIGQLNARLPTADVDGTSKGYIPAAALRGFPAYQKLYICSANSAVEWRKSSSGIEDGLTRLYAPNAAVNSVTACQAACDADVESPCYQGECSCVAIEFKSGVECRLFRYEPILSSYSGWEVCVPAMDLYTTRALEWGAETIIYAPAVCDFSQEACMKCCSEDSSCCAMEYSPVSSDCRISTNIVEHSHYESSNNWVVGVRRSEKAYTHNPILETTQTVGWWYFGSPYNREDWAEYPTMIVEYVNGKVIICEDSKWACAYCCLFRSGGCARSQWTIKYGNDYCYLESAANEIVSTHQYSWSEHYPIEESWVADDRAAYPS